MSETSKRNFLVRVWMAFWNGLTAFRIAVFNILFLLVLALFLRLLFAPGDRVEIEANTTLVLAPAGVIVEQYTGTPAERAINEALGQQLPETRLRDLLRALELAADDEDIVQVLISTDRLLAVPAGMLTELSAAVDRFRRSGKPVLAYSSGLDQSNYGLAALADEIWLNPEGTAMIQGYSYYRNYFREGLEKLRVDVNLFRVGEFKSAMEPFTRDDMSEADRATAEYFINGLWQEFLEIVSRQRGLPVARLLEVAENMVPILESHDGNAAAAALDVGLVDQLMTRPAVRAELAARGASDDRGGFRQISLKDYLALPRAPRLVERDTVGIIVARGVITEGAQPPGMIGSDSLSRLLRKARRDDNIRAVVLRIDSGGGSAFASEEIRQEMITLRESGKPVVVSMSNVAASGGYWIAMGADEIWAYPNTVTGSIGIFGFFPTFQNSLDAIGVHTDGFGVTPLSGLYRSDRELPEAARRMYQAIIEQGYVSFIELVGRYRDMSPQEVENVAQGRVWTGTQARDRDLVDQLGTLEQAVAAAARIAGVAEEYATVYVEPEQSAFEQFLAQMGAEALAHAGLDRLQVIPAIPGRDLYLDLMRQFAEVRTAGGRRGLPDAIAHCLCGPPL
ncbi:MAG: signal peptide peptidase SppA [Wenzhouxiangellaceae bacterium]